MEETHLDKYAPITTEIPVISMRTLWNLHLLLTTAGWWTTTQ